MKASLDPMNVGVRESRDSTDNPNSTAIIVGLDVTVPADETSPAA